MESVTELELNAKKRKECREKHKDFLERILNQKGKGQKKRRFFYCFVNTYSDGQPFRDDETEYEVIGKFGRRQWSSKETIDSFNVEDRDIVISICGDFGCFDY